MDSVKDFVSPKRFSISSYICVILHSICGVILIATTTALRLGETEKFYCAVDTTFATHKTYVEKTCFSIYNDVNNSPVRLFAFVLLSFGSVAVVSVIYSLAVGSRIDETERYSSGRNSPRLDGPNQSGTRTLYVFYFYYFHLVVRTIFGMVFTILHFTVLYTTGFDSKFACIYPKFTQQDPNITTAKNASVPSSSVTCENLAAKDKLSCSYAVFGCNVIFTLIMLLEVIYMIRSLTKRERFPYFKPKSWSCDFEFIMKYFLRKPHMPENIMLIGVDLPTSNSAQIYKEKVLNAPLTSDINNGFNTFTSLDDIFIDVIIQTEQAPLKFSKDMTRHEINDVYMKVPEHSIRLEEVKDLFYPNKDTKGNSPRTILALGRPGIGKTILTRKLMQDWAKEIDSFYLGKIAFFFKFRWFHFERLQNVTLKKFLQLGTELRESEFESIFAEIWANPQNAIFIFDGLDEFGGNLKKFQNFFDQSRMSPDDPTCPMSAMYLFIKILSGQILSDATVLVTSRPTANDVLSKLHFDRKVEMIGFTEEKIENYVEKFCANHEKSELKPKIWNHIKSSELKNLCYIPVNCFIVCVTLLNCVNDEGNDNALPTTLTELYQAALVYFHKNHDRNETKVQYEKVIEDLQELGFNGMENDQLIFDGEFVNEHMEESGLLHCLPVPIFQIQPQICFIHLTVQEFLAAKHIVETKEPEEIKEFISSHVKDGKWHLVLQLLAGLLGKKMEMSKEYRSCVLAFGEFLCPDIEAEHACDEPFGVMLMKCVRETKSESIAREIAVTSPLKRVTKIVSRDSMLSPSDWAAIVFVCKHLNFLKDLVLIDFSNLDCALEIAKLFRHRCIESLHMSLQSISRDEVAQEHLFSAIATSQCRIIHEHSKLECLSVDSDIFNDVASVSTWAEFFKNGPRICLKVLTLIGNRSSFSGMSEFFKVLGDEGFNQLSVLKLPGHTIDDDNMRILCNTLREKQHGLKELHLRSCSLTAKCTFLLGQLLRDEHCKITHLMLGDNRKLGDEGVRELLCNGFGQGQCKLDVLDIWNCSLTNKCMRDLSKALGDKLCGLTDLSLSGNKSISDKGVGMLFNALREKQCSLAKLDLSGCSLTKKCMASLCEALGDEHCRLTKLCLTDNDIGDEGVEMLFNALRVKQCSLTRLDLFRCSLTKKCMASLCEALGDEHCRVTKLFLTFNDIGDEGVEMLCCALVKEQCKLTSLNLLNCSLTDKCIPSLCMALGNVSCRVTELFLIGGLLGSEYDFENEFTSEGKKLLDEVKASKQCTSAVSW